MNEYKEKPLKSFMMEKWSTLKLKATFKNLISSVYDYLDPWGGEGNGTPLQYSCLENPMEGGNQAAVHGVTKSQAWLSDFIFTFHSHALEKEMATHSSVLAWRIPGTVEPGGLLSMGSHRVGHDWSDLAAAAVAATVFTLGVQQLPDVFLFILSFGVVISRGG